MGQQAQHYFAAQVSFKDSAFPSAASPGMLGQLKVLMTSGSVLLPSIAGEGQEDGISLLFSLSYSR